jgi:hypothetical protein
MAAALAQIYAVKMRYFDKLKEGYKNGFQCFAQQQARYLIGTDWNRKSYVIGLKDGYDRTIHRGASCPEWPKPCPPDTPGSQRRDYNVIEGGVMWLPEACTLRLLSLAHVYLTFSRLICMEITHSMLLEIVVRQLQYRTSLYVGVPTHWKTLGQLWEHYN